MDSRWRAIDSRCAFVRIDVLVRTHAQETKGFLGAFLCEKSANPRCFVETLLGINKNARTIVMAVKKANKKSDQPLITPLGDRVLLRPLSEKELEKKSSSGIIIPDTVSKEKPERGVVVAVGEGRYDDNGALVPMRVKKGDVVVFSKYGFDEFELEGAEYLILKEENILAVIK